MSTQKIVLKNIQEIGDYVIEVILKISSQSIKKRGFFTLGVSGGSIVNILAEKLQSSNASINWENWKVFFCDERCVDFSKDESTFGLYKTKVIDPLNCQTSWFAINPNLPTAKCAEDYENQLRSVFKNCEFPDFDLLLLGMGPDGHTCSLFPNHKLLKEDKLWIAPIEDSPKPPPCRVTMTLPVLNNSHNAMFISAGGSKADTIKMILSPTENDPNLPAHLVQPTNGQLFWVMDEPAASKI